MKYTDLDGEDISVALIVLLALITVGSTHPPKPNVDADKVLTKVQETRYIDPKEPALPALTTPYGVGYRGREKVVLSKSFIVALASALPSQATLEDIPEADGNIGGVINAIGLLNTILSDWSDSNSNVADDITMYIETYKGKAIGFTIVSTYGMPNEKKGQYLFSEAEARAFLVENKDYLVQNGVYDDLAALLDL